MNVLFQNILGTKEQCLKEEQQMIEDEASQFDTYMPYTEEEFVELLSNEEPSGNEDASESEVENIPDARPKKRKRVRKKAFLV